jgi:hypothetical protein
LSAASILDDELDSESDDALLVDRTALTSVSESSIADEESERLFELALIVAREASRLDDEDERLSEDARSVEMALSTEARSAYTLAELSERERLET